MRRHALHLALLLWVGFATAVSLSWLVASMSPVDQRVIAGWSDRDWVVLSEHDDAHVKLAAPGFAYRARGLAPFGFTSTIETRFGWPWHGLSCQWREPVNHYVPLETRLTGGSINEPLGPILTRPLARIPTSQWDYFVTARSALPLTPHPIALTGSTIALAAIWWLLLFPMTAPRVVQRWWRHRRGRCIRCAYDVRDGASERCPECGWVVGERITRVTRGRLFITALASVIPIGVCTALFVMTRPHELVPTLHRLAWRGDADAVKRLIDEGADPNATLDPRAKAAGLSAGSTALHWAAAHDRHDVIETLLDAGAFVDAQDDYGVTPLRTACRFGSLETVRLLIERGALAAGTRATNYFGETPLVTAIRAGRVEIVTFLLDFGVPTSTDGREIKAAIYPMSTDVLELLLERYEPTLRGPLAESPIMVAARAGRNEHLSLMIDAGVEVRHTSAESPLAAAVEAGNAEGVAILLRGTDLPLDEPRHALVWHAVDRYHDEILRLLLDAGANPETAPRDRNARPLALAIRRGHVEAARMLHEAGATPRSNFERVRLERLLGQGGRALTCERSASPSCCSFSSASASFRRSRARGTLSAMTESAQSHRLGIEWTVKGRSATALGQRLRFDGFIATGRGRINGDTPSWTEVERGLPWPSMGGSRRPVERFEAPEDGLLDGIPIRRLDIPANLAVGFNRVELEAASEFADVLPLRPVWPGFLRSAGAWSALWSVLLLTLPVIGGARRWRRRRRQRCRRCGYPRPGEAALAACTECGFDPACVIPLFSTRLLVATSTVFATLILATAVLAGSIVQPSKLYPMHRAAAHGDVAALRQLVKRGRNIDTPFRTDDVEADGTTPLVWAILHQQRDAVRVLLELGADPNHEDTRGLAPLGHLVWSPFFRSPSPEDEWILRDLLDAGADIDDPAPFNPLTLAIPISASMANLLLDLGADPVAPSALAAAARERQPAILERMLEEGSASGRLTSAHLQLATRAAIGMDQETSLRLLLDAGAQTTLAAPVSLGRERCTALLLERDYPVEPDHLVAIAVQRRKREIVRGLIDAGGELDTPVPGGRHPVILALHFGRDDIVSDLLSAGAEVSALYDDPGPLPWRSMTVEALQALVDAGLDVNRPDGSGVRPLEEAVRYNSSMIVETLLDAGADPRLITPPILTQLDWIAFPPDRLAALIEANADVDARDADGNTPLILAVHACNADAVEHLLRAGADPTATNDLGESALDHLQARLTIPGRRRPARIDRDALDRIDSLLFERE